MKVLAIDPGLYTGLAWFENGALRWTAMGPPGAAVPDVALIEVPQIYRGARSKVDPNDLITLAVRVGRYLERLEAAKCPEIILVKPAQWKGQLSKPVVKRRLQETLFPEELRIIGEARHDVWDAVGIGRWYLAGMSRPGVF